jgi:hypothetical protein
MNTINSYHGLLGCDIVQRFGVITSRPWLESIQLIRKVAGYLYRNQYEPDKIFEENIQPEPGSEEQHLEWVYSACWAPTYPTVTHVQHCNNRDLLHRGQAITYLTLGMDGQRQWRHDQGCAVCRISSASVPQHQLGQCNIYPSSRSRFLCHHLSFHKIHYRKDTLKLELTKVTAERTMHILKPKSMDHNLLQKLTVTQLVSKFPTFNGTQVHYRIHKSKPNSKPYAKLRNIFLCKTSY